MHKYFNLYYWFRKIVFSNLFQKLFLISDNFKRKLIFFCIYKSNHWRKYKNPLVNESISGLGSDIKITKKLVTDLNNFIKSNNIKSILDLGCGDFNWMKNIIKNNHELYYLGIEIVKDIVNTNNIF